MRILFRSLSAFLFLVVMILPAAAQDANASPLLGTSLDAATATAATTAHRASPQSFDEIIDRVVEREHMLLARMRDLHPIVETYLQNLKSDAKGNTSLANDQYFLGHLDMSNGPEYISFPGDSGFAKSQLRKLAHIYLMHFRPDGFAQMIVPDNNLDRHNYNFNLVRREFLGEVRCIVIDVQPKLAGFPGRFEGRIWVEDQEYNLVRFNGTYSRPPRNTFYLHFDSWRANLAPGVWLPSHIYSEESDLKIGWVHAHLKAQTRLWGYDLKDVGKNRRQELAQILVDSQQSIKDQSGAAADPSPVVARRMWERQAEDNVVERLEKIGLLAPPGDVDKVLQTVVDNLMLTNGIELPSDVHCRVLITTPFESLTIGHTLVLSRGLLDVLPDEATLAMVLAHELSHIVLGHHFDAQLAFYDRTFSSDQQFLQRLDLKSHPEDEEAADAKALELLKNSPYRDKLGSVGLFLKALRQRAPDLPNLIRPHLGNALAQGQSIRMSALFATAPPVDDRRIDQIAALPLGGRIKLDPWSDQVELARATPVVLGSVNEKMPFEILPFFPYLTRLERFGADRVASTDSGSK